MALDTIGLIGNPNKDEAPVLASRLIAAVAGRARILLAPEIAPLVDASGAARAATSLKELAAADLVFVLGGDGTLLHAVRELDGAPVPLLGINVGSLGFLTETDAAGVEDAARRILAGDYAVFERPLLTAAIRDRDGAIRRELKALNDVVVDEGSPTRRAVRLRMSLSGEEVGTFTADGIVVATPGGSTAYNLSAGGPVLGPAVRALVVTPICSHTMAVRPLVYPDTETLVVEDLRSGLEIKVTADGQVYHPVPGGGSVEISVDPERRARFVDLSRRSYYEILRTRLRWAGGGREP